MGKIEAVVFDIGNVLVEWHPERPFDRLLGRAGREALFERVDFGSMNDRVDLGDDIAVVVRELADKHPDDHDKVMLWHTQWLEMLAPEVPRSAAMLRALRAKGVPVFALSNFGDATFDLAERNYPVLKEFDQRFISGRLRLMKPDAAIYAHVEAETGVAPGALFFIDDRAENIAAAKARGWRGHLFDGPDGLAQRLVSEGLLTETEVAG